MWSRPRDAGGRGRLDALGLAQQWKPPPPGEKGGQAGGGAEQRERARGEGKGALQKRPLLSFLGHRSLSKASSPTQWS